jgi:rod shape-determining protein MreC
MKTRVVFFFIVLFLVVLFASKENSYVKDKILLLTTPIKEFYTQSITNITKLKEQYIHQQESIERLTQENQKLKSYLIEQTNYLNQIDKLFDVIPSLEKLPHKSIALVQPIGYTKLNSYSTILLNRPQEIVEDKIYGLMQNSSVVGTAQLRNGILYGHLISSKECKFSVHIGKVKAPGIAVGAKDGYLKIKYIPKWSKIKEGDIVETSGADKIFFANVPVGKVKTIQVKSAYKTAVIEPYADYLHINYLFLIQDPTPTLLSKYNADATKLYPYPQHHFNPTKVVKANSDANNTKPKESGDMVQTTMPEVDPKEHETPKEEQKVKKESPKKRTMPHNRVPTKPKLPKSGLDMF